MALGLFGNRARRRLRFGGAIAGAAAGAGFMYFLDPRRGAARRADVAQRAGRAVREVEGTVEAGARDLEHRARGLAHEARERIRGERPPDEVLVERVRAKLGRLVAHPGAIEVACRDGRVTLSGHVFQAEHGRAVRGVRMVRAVQDVEDRLQAHATAEGVPALQGAGPSPGPLPEPLQHTWSPGTKLLAGIGAVVLLGRAILGRGFGRLFAGLAGATLLARVLSDAERGSERRRLARAASEEANREREAAADAESHAGAWHPGSEAPGAPAGERSRGRRRRGRGRGPEVREVKSPAEMEQGEAHGSPEPTFGDRVDRPGHPAGGASPAEGAPRRAGGEDVGGGDVVARSGLESPPPGSPGREGSLGEVAPRQEDATDEEGVRAPRGPGGRER